MRHPFFCLVACAGVTILPGCASYRPAPVDPVATRAQWQARRLDDPALAARLGPWLPARDHGQWPPKRYGRAELVLAALALNPDVAEARARLVEASAAVETAGALPNPTLGLALERYTQAQADSAPWLWGLSTDFLLDGGLRRRLRLQLADQGVRGARLDYAGKLWSVRSAVRDALEQQLVARRQATLAARTVATATALEQAARQRVALGEDQPQVALQAAQTLARARSDQAAAGQRAASAQAQLARAVGVPAAALQGLALRWDDFDRPAEPPAARLDTLADRALLTRSDLERALVDYASRETELHQQVHAQYPQLSLGPGYTYDHGLRKLTFNASLSLPVFNQNQGPIAEARARREAAAAHVRTVQADIAAAIDAARSRLAAAWPALAAARAGSHAAGRARDQAEHAFALGAIDRSALLEARLAALAAEQSTLAALDAAWQAEAALEDALRAPLDPAEATLGPAVGGRP
ncbi:MAG TPA: TolC family protein [Frateuria sp.]|uniref:TolC family protein n=1 Tax=Frateuria sp. TaxID=2211372 RepID=UPI002D807190|nr:TolC family protein [Frateuria sp.]HET6804896.1 TolC family protein [Frateuria sp.]